MTLLNGTMQGMQVQSPLEAAEQQMQALLAQQAQAVAQAQSQASQAGGAYQQAAGAPMPDIGALAAFLPALLGNTASVLGQNPQYARQAQQSVDVSRETLFKQREQNLTALRDRYIKAAESAERLGNAEMEMKFRAQADSVAQKHQTLRDQENQKAQEERAKLDRQSAERIEASRAADRESPTEKLTRESTDNLRSLLGNYIQAGKNPPQEIIDQAIEAKLLPKGMTADRFLGGARKPTALEIKNTLIDKNVNVLPADKWSKMRQLREKPLSDKRSNKKAGRENLRTFDLSFRNAGEAPEQFISRLQSTMDPMNPKKRLYTDAEIATAGRRLFTEAEQEVK